MFSISLEYKNKETFQVLWFIVGHFSQSFTHSLQPFIHTCSQLFMHAHCVSLHSLQFNSIQRCRHQRLQLHLHSSTTSCFFSCFFFFKLAKCMLYVLKFFLFPVVFKCPTLTVLQHYGFKKMFDTPSRCRNSCHLLCCWLDLFFHGLKLFFFIFDQPASCHPPDSSRVPCCDRIECGQQQLC